MDADTLKTLAIQLAAITERLEQRSEAAVQRVEDTSARMEGQARHLTDDVDGFVQKVAHALQQQSKPIIQGAADSAIEPLNAQLAATTRMAQQAAEGLAQERRNLAKARTTLVLAGSAALLVGSLLAAGGATYAVAQSRTELQKNRVDATLLKAINMADVTLCGDRLCAHIDRAAALKGVDGPYQPVRMRNAAGK